MKQKPWIDPTLDYGGVLAIAGGAVCFLATGTSFFYIGLICIVIGLIIYYKTHDMSRWETQGKILDLILFIGIIASLFYFHFIIVWFNEGTVMPTPPYNTPFSRHGTTHFITANQAIIIIILRIAFILTVILGVIRKIIGDKRNAS